MRSKKKQDKSLKFEAVRLCNGLSTMLFCKKKKKKKKSAENVECMTICPVSKDKKKKKKKKKNRQMHIYLLLKIMLFFFVFSRQIFDRKLSY